MTDWERTTLGETLRLQRGHDLPAQERRDGEVPIVGSFGITGWHDRAKVTGPGVTIGRSGASFGTAVYVDADYWPLNTCLYVTDFCGNDPYWAYALLSTIDFSGYNSGSAQPSLNRNLIAGIPVLRPSPREQRGIAQVLLSLDSLVDHNLAMAATLEDLARSVAGEASAKAVLRDLAIPVDSKQVRPVGAVSHYSLPAFDASAQPEVTDGATIKSGKQVIEGPTVLVSRLNPKWERCWMAYATESNSVASTEFLALQPQDIEPEELWAITSAPTFWTAMRERVTGTTGSHQRVDKAAILNIDVRDPRMLTTAQRALIVSSVQQAHGLRQEVGTLQASRKELLPMLISGRIRVSAVEGLVA